MKTLLHLLFIVACISVIAPARGQALINYADGETNSTAYSTSPPNDPTTLNILLVTDSAQQSGALTGTGGVIKTGAGQVMLSSSATNYTGATTITTGTLGITNNSVFNSPVTVNLGATLKLNIATDVKLLQGVSGPGSILVEGNAATARLAGDDSGFTGTFTLPSGTRGMMWSSVNAGSAAANWDLSGEFAYVETGDGDHTIKLGALTGSNSNTNIMSFGGSGIKTLEVGALNTDTTYAGKIQNGDAYIGLSKIGTGTLTLTGSGGFGGGALVNGGTLAFADGANMATNNIHIGEGGNTGTLTVSSTGPATFLTAQQSLTVGDNLGGGGGTGTLTVGGGGGSSSVILSDGVKLMVGADNATGTVNLITGGTISVGGTDGIQKSVTGIANFNWSGGTIRVVNNSLTTSLPMTLTGSSFMNTNGFNATLTGELSGTGGLTKSGPGSLLLPNANTYQGGTTIASGSVIANNNASLGTGPITLFTGSKLEVGDPVGPIVDEITIANSITIGIGGGVLTNYGSNSKAIFSGPITLNNNLTILAGSDDPAYVKVTGGITGTGNVILQGVNTARVIVETGAINNTGTVTNNGSSPLETVIHSVIGTNVTGVIQNSATSALILDGINTYTGPTTVTAGTLFINNSNAGAVTVAPAGILGGNGTIAGLATINGTLAPGFSAVGLLTFTGDLTLNTGSTTAIEINGLAAAFFDRISIGSTLAYGGTLSLTFNGFTPQAGDTFQIFKDFSAQSGTFTAIGFSAPDLAANFDYASGTLSFVAIPEPSTVALLVLAGGFAAMRLRRLRS
ncbi:MAG: beta strand repeat-containing protein [Chthoniobacterales bacterium]